jgi:hypothetical protein
MITSTSGCASRISSVWVATPLMSRASSPDEMKRRPRSASSVRQWRLHASKSAPWKTTSAPRLRMASTLSGLAFSGATMVAATPKRRAA